MENFKEIFKYVEMQIDLTKESGGVIRINSEEGCILRICKIPKELLLNPDRTIKSNIDIQFNYDTTQKEDM